MNLEQPVLDDNWDAQVELEREMLELGSSRMRTKIRHAVEKRDMNRLRPYRNLLTEWVEPLAKTIGDWTEYHTNRGGSKPIALPALKNVGPEVCAMVTLKVVLRMLGQENRGLLALAFEIGTWLEHEDRAKAWMEQDPDGWKKLEGSYRRRGSTAAHMKRSRVVIFNKHIRDNIEWSDWSGDLRRRAGLVLLDFLCVSTKRFSVVKDKSAKRRKGKRSYPLILKADDDLVAWLEDALGAEELHRPAYMPTLIKPKPWDGPRDGGYWTPYVKAPFLIRFKASHEDQRQRAIDEYEALDMPEVYEAINNVQNTAWQINRPVFDVARKIWDNDLALCGFTRREPEVVPQRPEYDENDIEGWREWRKSSSDAHRRNAQRVSTYIRHERSMLAAQRFVDEDEFYFPHMLDFRGRMYPIPTDLQPQGGDLQRGLLTFRHGSPVTDDESAWLAVHLANVWGKDKLPFADRQSWVFANEEMWTSIAKDPMQDRRWMEPDSDDPWQSLAAILEWSRWLSEGAGMVSNLPIRVDGTCNGIQHLSAMVRDLEGGQSVNLTPSDKPQDIYQDVADNLTVIVEKSDSEFAKKWLKLVDGKFDRSITKRPVMILPYGGTKGAYVDYTIEWLEKNDPHEKVFDDRWKASYWLAMKMWDAVGDKVKRAREVMEWIKVCSGVTSKTGLPLYWSTPAGFIVRHFYGQREKTRIKTLIDGQRVDLVHFEVSPTLDKRSQAQGIAPNFVHSMDAAALMLSVNLAAVCGVKSMTVIHDAYGTVAGDMFTMSAVIRQSFEGMYKHDVLEEFRQSCSHVTGKIDAYPHRPPMGALDISQVNESEYFFA